jgi:hypothetical protein
MEAMRNAYKILDGKAEVRDHLGDPGLVGKIILNCIIEK